jgi:FixJ family two-component response regulator
MSEPPSVVFVVDDDASIRDALRRLIRSDHFGEVFICCFPTPICQDR